MISYQTQNYFYAKLKKIPYTKSILPTDYFEKHNITHLIPKSPQEGKIIRRFHDLYDCGEEDRMQDVKQSRLVLPTVTTNIFINTIYIVRYEFARSFYQYYSLSAQIKSLWRPAG